MISFNCLEEVDLVGIYIVQLAELLERASEFLEMLILPPFHLRLLEGQLMSLTRFS